MSLQSIDKRDLFLNNDIMLFAKLGEIQSDVAANDRGTKLWLDGSGHAKLPEGDGTSAGT